jgi:multidrug efflux pump subunit AcrA (membrane-fusion protein)
MSSFYVDLPVNEVSVAQVVVGQPVTLTFDGVPGRSLTGKVTRIASSGDKTGNVVTYLVRVTIDPAGEPLLASMTTTATIAIGQVSNVIRIPNRFIQTDPGTGKTSALVQQPDGSFQSVAITLGLTSNTYSEVKSGLAVGDVVEVAQ